MPPRRVQTSPSPISAAPTPVPLSRRDPPPHQPSRGRQASPRWYNIPPPQWYVLSTPLTRRFGIGRWAPLLLTVVPALALLARRSTERWLILTLILVQLLIATFVAITMMGWWFAGRTMLTVLPLFVVPLTLLVARAGVFGRVFIVVLGLCTLTFTAGLAHAGHVGEITTAVDPFDMRFTPFQAVGGLFPLYTLWTTETWQLTYLWWALFAISTGATVWPETLRAARWLRRQFPDAVSKGDPGLPTDERPGS